MYIYNVEIYCSFLMYIVMCILLTINNLLPKQKQVEKHVLRNTQLTELLHITNEKPITVRDENLNIDLHKGCSTTSSLLSPRTLSFVGPSTALNFVHEAGLPKHITGVEASAIFRAIKLNTTTNLLNGNGAAQKKPVVWQPPIHACKAMSTHFSNRQLPDDDEEKVVRIILRAQPNFQNKPGHANVKVAVDYDRGVKIHFGKCVVFLKDSQDDYFVVLQWYNQEGREPFDSVSGLVQLVLRPPNVTTSYSVMPIASIINGALITTSENKLWVLMSPRESKAYEQTNS